MTDIKLPPLARLASMMPRHFTEEIRMRGEKPTMDSAAASMMPRHFTEEILQGVLLSPLANNCFNDASAFHRGNPTRRCKPSEQTLPLQ